MSGVTFTPVPVPVPVPVPAPAPVPAPVAGAAAGDGVPGRATHRPADPGSRRRTVPLSVLGRLTALAALAACAAGWWFGWVEVATAGVALTVALLVAAVLSLGRSTYAVTLDLSGDRVRVGERAVGRIVVRNTSRRRLLPAAVELPVGRGAADFPLPSLGPGAEHDDVFAVPTSRRGVVVVGPVRSVRGDPWGLVRRRLVWTDPVDLYVHPATVALPGGGHGLLRDLEGTSTRALSANDLSFHTLRDYVPGDDRRHIHWKSSARHGDLVVRQFEDTRRSHTAVALSLDPADYADAEEIELAVSATASLALATLRDAGRTTVLAGDGPLRTGTATRLLDDCATLEPAVGHPGVGDLAGWVAAAVPQASVVVLVTGSATDAATLRAHTARIAVGVPVLVLSCDPAAGVAVRTDGALTLVRLPALADLPRVVRRVVTA
ncbi:DUF58 domain-containing protein [Cellulomonas sp. ATA003]|uniref:DUF58 domain-containing protein n=1 Tax=Cellulomonas sp. ATA003 TaxID=3073064 RepID=UPI0028737806|nr:DUF58 domain-containing protein [Cellulomonas sp. ATA003]WNB85971.1 DUF58 domain-containing protein [Cellulomonas sp. ATA003]